METHQAIPITVGAQEGQTVAVAGGSYRIIVSGTQTSGEFATIEMVVPAHAGPGPHSHADFHETFYVIEGAVQVTSQAGSYTAEKGAYVVIPKGGIVHQFKNHTASTARLLCTVVPAGLEEMFIAMGDITDPKEMPSLAARFGQKLYPPDFLDAVK